ncbi:MAG: membrane fusion protein MtrC [Chthoniobacteraceae bacterium]
MKYVSFVLSVLSVAAHAADPVPSTAPAQASIDNPVKEADLTTVTLTPEAAKRLGITTLPVEKKPVAHERLYGGEITLPLAVSPGTDTFTALAPPQNATEMLKLAELQAAADGELSQAEVKLEAAKLAHERAEKLLENQTGSERAVEESRAALQLAQAAHEHGVARRALLGPGFATDPDGKRWWVRAAIPAADARTLDPEADATVTPLGSAESVPAKRMAGAPATANAFASTVDWYFEIVDPQRQRRLGERVEVRIPALGSSEERLIVPWAAVLHDIHGGQWVYEMTGPTNFVRRRVQVARVVGTDAVVASGPVVGAKIVTNGSAELFGIEFGPGK